MGTVKYTGPVASFHCPTEAEIRSLKVHFSPKQEGSGDPSPENIRPIVGWEGVTALKSSKNLFDTSKISCSHPSTTWNAQTEMEDMVFANGELSGTVQSGWRDTTVFTQNTPFKPGTYTLSFDYINGIKNYKWKPVIISSTYSGWYTSYKGSTMADNDNGHKEITFTADKPFYVSLNLNSFDYAATTARNKLYNIQLELGSTVTPYEPCKISTTNYEFGVLGKNKFDKSQSIDGARIAKFTGADYDVDSADYYISPFIPVIPGATYTKNSPIVDAYHRFATYTSNDVSTFVRVFDNSNTITIQPNEKYLRFCGEIIEKDTTQLELGSSATTYEPYDPKHTVYGGWVDLISGEVCEEWHKMVIDTTSRIGLFPWGGIKTDTTTETEYATALFRRESTDPKAWTIKDNLCDKLPISITLRKINTAYIYDGDTYGPAISLPTSIIGTTNETLTEYLTDNPFTFVYKQRVPNTYYLAPTQLQTFLGQNNVWSNADYVEVEYDLHETQTILARKQFIIANQPHIEKPAAAPLQNFVTDMAAPLKECKIHFSPVQEGEGTPSPDNIRSIMGWTGIEIHKTGKNLCDTPTSDDILANWEVASAGYNKKISGLPVGQRFTLQANITKDLGENISNLRFYLNGKRISGVFFNTGTPLGVHSTNNEVDDNGELRLYHNGAGLTKYGAEFNNIQLELGSTVTDYEPYNGTTLPIDWSNSAGTVYGGYVDLVTGEVWSEYEYFDMTTMNFNQFGAGSVVNTYSIFPRTIPTRNDMFCNFLKVVANPNVSNVEGIDWNTGRLNVCLLASRGLDSVSAFKSWLQEMKTNGITPTLVARLSSPELVGTIAPQQLSTLRGQNNVWSNANGDIKLKYWTH